MTQGIGQLGSVPDLVVSKLTRRKMMEMGEKKSRGSREQDIDCPSAHARQRQHWSELSVWTALTTEV
jgi:hypothetical protein